MKICVLPYREETREEFLAKRPASIGSSEIADVFSIKPYNCVMRLALQKNGVKADFELDNENMKRGRDFEHVAADMFQKEMGYPLERTGQAYLEDYPYMTASADRLLVVGGNRCPVEIKCPNQWSMKKIKADGLPERYIMQLQYQIMCYGAEIGYYAVYCVDTGEFQHFSVKRDNALIEIMFCGAIDFWRRKNDINSFLRLSEKDDRCKKCNYLFTCREKELHKYVRLKRVRDHLNKVALEF